MSNTPKVLLLLGVFVILACQPGSAHAYFLGMPSDPIEGGSWYWPTWTWFGTDGYIEQETGELVDVAFDRYVLRVNSWNPFEPSRPGHLITISPDSWSVDSNTTSGFSVSGPDLVGMEQPLVVEQVWFNNAETPGLAVFDLTSLMYNDGAVVEWATITGVYSFGLRTWVEPYTTVYHDVSMIPEPGSLILLGTLLFGMVTRRLLRRDK